MMKVERLGSFQMVESFGDGIVPFPSSLLSKAVSVLRKYGGSLWVADPAYCFTNSDGTGATSDGSDAGYVRDLCGNTRPLFQSTTSFKPKLCRVPKRLGPELVTNGGFAIDANWTKGADWTITGGQAVLTGSGSGSTLAQNNVFSIGKTYSVGFDVSATGGSICFENAAFSPVASGSSGRVVTTWTADRTSISFKRVSGAVNGTVDNVSVREVLEWGWAWVFDGTNDLLATVAQPSVAAETIGVVKRLYAQPTSTRSAITKANVNQGIELYASATTFNGSQMGTGTGYLYKAHMGTASTSVQVAVLTAASRQIRVNGSSGGTDVVTYASSAASILVGGGTVPFNSEILGGFYAPTVIPDAELLIVERAMAQLAGLTI